MTNFNTVDEVVTATSDSMCDYLSKILECMPGCYCSNIDDWKTNEFTSIYSAYASSTELEEITSKVLAECNQDMECIDDFNFDFLAVAARLETGELMPIIVGIALTFVLAFHG